MKATARIGSTILALIACGGVFLGARPAAADVTVVSGELAHHAMTNDLFRIDHLWMQVTPDTQFYRWLREGEGEDAEIILTTQADRFADVKNVRILSGRLIHNTAPGARPVVHVLFLKDEETGTLGAVTFQTTDIGIARTFSRYDGEAVSVVIRINR